MTWKIPLFKISWDESDVRHVEAVIRSGMSWADGPDIPEFERRIADFTVSPFCLTFNSGTSALHALLQAYGIGAGDEVIVPSFTFVATANAPLFVGARPVFADIEDVTFGLDPEEVVKRITGHTKAIIPVHYAGCPCRIRELREISEDHHLILIEDAAESFGADILGQKTGTFGDAGVFSFCQNKIITTGEGGAVITGDSELHDRLKLIRSHGRLEAGNYFSSTESMDYVTLGFNFRLSSISAALGTGQMEKVADLIHRRRQRAAYYRHVLGGFAGCRCPEPPRGYSHVYQIFSILASNRDELMKYMQELGIMTKVYFPPVHETSFYRKILGYEDHLPVTERVAGEILSLPFHADILDEEMDMVAQSIGSFGEVKKNE